jgi:carbonic anhydrase/acetyltransferase-like protein (isoleucine patch superfamily)
MIHSFDGRVPEIADSIFVAWNAEISGEVRIGPRASVWYGAVIRGDLAPIFIGELSNVQDAAVLHVVVGGPCILGKGVTIGHGAIVHACTVGDWCLVGMGATLLDGCEIESESIVGAGALVTQGKKFPPRSMIFGNPAKLVRSLTDKEVAGLHEHAHWYADLSEKTRTSEVEIPRPSRG